MVPPLAAGRSPTDESKLRNIAWHSLFYRPNFDRIKSRYKTVKGKPKAAQQGVVQGMEPYYVRMGVAWLLATALGKYPEQTRLFVRSSNLPVDVVKLYVRKARESFRTRTFEALSSDASSENMRKQ